MRLKRLFVTHLRNLVDVQFEPDPELTVLLGDNGQGKTNLLEAVHLSASLSPLKSGGRNGDLIARAKGNAPRAKVATLKAVYDVGGPLDVAVEVSHKGKKAKLSDKVLKNPTRLARELAVVAFVPDDLMLVKGSPEARRRLLDRVAFQLDPTHLTQYRAFERALKQRNKLLKSPHVDGATLAAFDGPYIEAAAALWAARMRAMHQYGPAVASTLASILGADGPALVLGLGATVLQPAERRCSTILDAGDLAQRLQDKVAQGHAEELRRRTSLYGPHRDDVLIRLGDMPAKTGASQGQIRSIALAFRLAQLELLTAVRGTAPLLLLDDVVGELDPVRAQQLFAAVRRLRAQTFVSTTHVGTLPPGIGGALWHVREGHVSRAAPGAARSAAGHPADTQAPVEAPRIEDAPAPVVDAPVVEDDPVVEDASVPTVDAPAVVEDVPAAPVERGVDAPAVAEEVPAYAAPVVGAPAVVEEVPARTPEGPTRAREQPAPEPVPAWTPPGEDVGVPAAATLVTSSAARMADPRRADAEAVRRLHAAHAALVAAVDEEAPAIAAARAARAEAEARGQEADTNEADTSERGALVQDSADTPRMVAEEPVFDADAEGGGLLF